MRVPMLVVQDTYWYIAMLKQLKSYIVFTICQALF